MLKKYIPYIVLLLAALLLYFVKTHQGNNRKAVNVTAEAINSNEGFNRHPAHIIYTKHARCRMDCRHITEEEVKEILATGKLRADKIEQGEKGNTYPLDGRTSGDKMVRIVVAPKKEDIVLVTVIDLDTDWPCGDCK